MIRKLLIIFCLLTTYAFAELSAPPVLRDEPVLEQQYFKALYDNHNVLTVTTTAPDGNIRGQKGKVILYNNSGTYELFVNTDGSTTWQQIQ